jgi:hypothetical protein
LLGGLLGLELISLISLSSTGGGAMCGSKVPRSSGSRISPAENRASGDCRRELTFECEESGGVGRLDSGTYVFEK